MQQQCNRMQECWVAQHSENMTYRHRILVYNLNVQCINHEHVCVLWYELSSMRNEHVSVLWYDDRGCKWNVQARNIKRHVSPYKCYIRALKFWKHDSLAIQWPLCHTSVCVCARARISVCVCVSDNQVFMILLIIDYPFIEPSRTDISYRCLQLKNKLHSMSQSIKTTSIEHKNLQEKRHYRNILSARCIFLLLGKEIGK